jgi:hypothetical protein
MTDSQQPAPRRRTALWVILFLLAIVPSGYLYLTGKQERLALQGEKDVLQQRTEALADSLDGARTQILLDAALTTLRAGDYEGARTLTSEFFDRIDRRSRQPGAGAQETQARMSLLALRDQAITELSRQSPEAAGILQELVTLSLPLADPESKARTSLTTPGAGPGDTLHRDTTALPRIDTLPDMLSESGIRDGGPCVGPSTHLTSSSGAPLRLTLP